MCLAEVAVQAEEEGGGGLLPYGSPLQPPQVPHHIWLLCLPDDPPALRLISSGTEPSTPSLCFIKVLI